MQRGSFELFWLRSCRVRGNGKKIIIKNCPPNTKKPCTDVGSGGQEEQIDAGLILAEFDPVLLLRLAELLENPLELLVSKAHLSKGFYKVAHAAQGLLGYAALRKWSRPPRTLATPGTLTRRFPRP